MIGIHNSERKRWVKLTWKKQTVRARTECLVTTKMTSSPDTARSEKTREPLGGFHPLSLRCHHRHLSEVKMSRRCADKGESQGSSARTQRQKLHEHAHPGLTPPVSGSAAIQGHFGGTSAWKEAGEDRCCNIVLVFVLPALAPWQQLSDGPRGPERGEAATARPPPPLTPA